MLSSTGWIYSHVVRMFSCETKDVKIMGFAILIYIDNDAFYMIKTHHFIIYILEYVVEKASCCCSLQNTAGFSIPGKTHKYLIQGDL